MDVVLGKKKVQPQQADPATDANTKAIASWNKRDNSASCCIVATIEETFQQSLINFKSCKEMRDRLAAQYEQADSENKYFCSNVSITIPFNKAMMWWCT